jgi:uncharacterized membrane protein YhhN
MAPWHVAILPPAALSCLAVAGLVYSDYRSYRPGRYLCKPLAALAFLWLALNLGALDSSYGNWLFAGLTACALGDLLLMPDDQHSFLGGLLAFLSGHLLFCVAFLQLPVNPVAVAIGTGGGLLLFTGSLIWLRPHLAGIMRMAVPVYILVITAMLVTATGTAGHAAGPWILAGALGFALSDLAVAKRQFIGDDPLVSAWGTGLYFLSQMLLAGSVTGA